MLSLTFESLDGNFSHFYLNHWLKNFSNFYFGKRTLKKILQYGISADIENEFEHQII